MSWENVSDWAVMFTSPGKSYISIIRLNAFQQLLLKYFRISAIHVMFTLNYVLEKNPQIKCVKCNYFAASAKQSLFDIKNKQPHLQIIIVMWN